MFLNFHEISCITGRECTICANFQHLKILDKDIDHNLIKNYCKEDKGLVDKMNLEKLSFTAQRIHIIGNHWPLVNALKHRNFKFFCKNPKISNDDKTDSICITDTNIPVNKMNQKLIITQGYCLWYDLNSVDYLVVQKKYIDDSFCIESFDKQIIPEKGFLVIDLKSHKKFYTE
jgi:hypothetical protein